MKSKRRISLRLIFGIALFAAGFITAIYPFVMSNFKAVQMNQEISAFEQYVEQVKESNNSSEKDLLNSLYNELTEYNKSLINNGQEISCSDDFEEFGVDIAKYGFEDNIIGVIDIPKLDQKLPLYLGASKKNMADGATVLGSTSAPIGGVSTNCVIAGHRGSVTGTKFRYINKLEPGDIFLICILEETLTYQVDNISIVEPHEGDTLLIEEGKDLCTLVTCTPYGINTHRMLVRGHRVENAKVATVRRITADAVQIEPVIVAPFVAAPMLLLLLIALLIPKPKKNRRT